MYGAVFEGASEANSNTHTHRALSCYLKLPEINNYLCNFGLPYKHLFLVSSQLWISATFSEVVHCLMQSFSLFKKLKRILVLQEEQRRVKKGLIPARKVTLGPNTLLENQQNPPHKRVNLKRSSSPWCQALERVGSRQFVHLHTK